MLDPFVNDPTRQLDRESDRLNNEEQAARHFGRATKNANAAEHWGQWIGHLMIKIGNRLTKEETTTSRNQRII